jgi:hypothetical protein
MRTERSRLNRSVFSFLKHYSQCLEGSIDVIGSVVQVRREANAPDPGRNYHPLLGNRAVTIEEPSSCTAGETSSASRTASPSTSRLASSKLYA